MVALDERAADRQAKGQLHIVSWNVAGWRTTIEQINRFQGGLQTFMDRHAIDILCIQEVKLPSKAIAAQPIILGADLKGFDTFWACNEGSGQQRHGLNGVATFARKGLIRRADAAPLQSAELDAEGRCVMTDHGAFVIFNVYVPNSSGGVRVPFKLRWLRALRNAMQRARAVGKGVVLAGDLNMTHRAADSHWAVRSIDVGRILRLRHADTLEADVREAIDAIHSAWPAVEEALRQKDVRPIETRNFQTGQTFKKFSVYARRCKDGEFVRIGHPQDWEEDARLTFCVDGIGIDGNGHYVLGGERMEECEVIVHKPGMINVSNLMGCLKALAGLNLDEQMRQRLSDMLGERGSSMPIRAWLDAILSEDHMADSFLKFHSAAMERFTCWDQYRNKRFENVGARIDYILVDDSLLEKHASRGECNLATWGSHDATSPQAALAAATLGGLSEAVGYEGGGLKPLKEDEYVQMFRADQLGPSTGMIYTPPQLSDHIAVSLLLQDVQLGGDLAGGEHSLIKDAATKQCQPQYSVKRMTDFFARKPSKEGELVEPPAKRQAVR